MCCPDRMGQNDLFVFLIFGSDRICGDDKICSWLEQGRLGKISIMPVGAGQRIPVTHGTRGQGPPSAPFASPAPTAFTPFLQSVVVPINDSLMLWHICRLAEVHSGPSSRGLTKLNGLGPSIGLLDKLLFHGHWWGTLHYTPFSNSSNMKENTVIWREYAHAPPFPPTPCSQLQQDGRKVNTMQTEETKLLELLSALNETWSTIRQLFLLVLLMFCHGVTFCSDVGKEYLAH